MPPKPNLIFIVTDDQGYGDISLHGNPWLHTPNLDAMGRRSIQLDDHHHDPVCSPSRAALMTGQYATRSGVWEVTQGRHLLDLEAVTMADRFAANNYRTAMFGKWHLGDTHPFLPEQRGFEYALYHKGGGVGELPDHWGNSYTDDTYCENGQPRSFTGYCTDVFFKEAFRYVEDHREEPFFVYLATNAMHSPFRVPEKYSLPYREMGIPEQRANFYGMISNFDENIGRLFEKLQSLEIVDNTIVVFTADHGTAAGFDPSTGDGYNAGMRGKKRSVYDGGHRVNFFIHQPSRLNPGIRISFPTAHIDILPTLAELCGLEDDPPCTDGLNLAPYFDGDEKTPPERQIFIHLQPDQPVKWHHCVVIDGPWRLVNGEELYDIRKDPGQQNDIASQQGTVVYRLREAYERWWESLLPKLNSHVNIPIGLDAEPTCELTARDWHPLVGGIPWMQEWIDSVEGDCNGFWLINFVRRGRYAFELRRFPRGVERPLNADHVSLVINDETGSVAVEESDAAAHITLDVGAGPARLSTKLDSSGGPRNRGAFYIYVQYVGPAPTQSLPH